MALMPVEDALQRLLAGTKAITETEPADLHSASGRVLAEDVAARLTHPPFDASAMDGYALRHTDIATIGSVVEVIGTSAAGHAFSGTVEAGQAVRIFTGAPVPQGADTVLLQEDAERMDSHHIRTAFVPDKGRHIRPAGQDFRLGETVLKRGTVLDFGQLTVAAAMNHPALSVYRQPRIAIIATGDELVFPGSVPGPDQIIASNTFGIAALARNAGASILDLGIVGDDRTLIAQAVQKAVDARVDILVTLGGASVGDHDLVQSTLTGLGMVLDFWKIAMRPGKPLMVGRLGNMRVLGLPGNPVSSLVCGILFLEPLLFHMRHQSPKSRTVTVSLSGALPDNDQRQDYIRSTLVQEPDGSLTASPFAKQDSSMMKIFSNAGCLVIRPPFAPAICAGERCEAILLKPAVPRV